jgi:hypothetical protein
MPERKSLSDMRQKIFFELVHTDPFIHAALHAYEDTDEAICAALIAHSHEHERLIDELVKAKSGQPLCSR